MTWFMAVLVRGPFVEDSPDEDRMGDLLFRLVEAPDSERAYGRALELVEKRPSERVVLKEQLTVFAPDEPPSFFDEQPIFGSPRENDGT